jgi:CRP-like cAMP-binding protein
MMDVEVGTIPGGFGFGELALISSKPRAATIYCKEDSNFAILNKAAFDQIFQKVEKDKMKKKLDFFRNFKILSHQTRQTLSKLTYHMTLKNYRIGQIIYEQGDSPDGVYFTVSGRFEINVQYVNKSRLKIE